MKRHAVQIGLGLLVLLSFLAGAVRLAEFRFLDQLDLWSYDARLRLGMPGGVDRRIVIVDLDEKSLAEVGRWPWGRDRIAALLEQLFRYHGVTVVGFDVVFGEPDASSGLPVLERLAQRELQDVPPFRAALERLRPSLDYDRLFAASLKQYPVVLGYYFTGYDTPALARVSGKLPPPAFPPGAFGARKPFVPQATGYGANLDIFQAHASGAGHFNPMVDLDGVSRRVPLLLEYQGGYYEAFSLAVARAYLGFPAIVAGVAADGGEGYAGLEWVGLGDMKIPVDRQGGALIPYRGVRGSFRYVSAVDALQGKLGAGELAGAIVLVGASAPGLVDLRSTPVAETYPGVEIHANLIAGMLDQAVKQRPAYFLAVEVFTLLLIGVALALILPRLSPLLSSLVTLLLLAATVGANLAAWRAGMVLPIVTPVLLILSLYALDMVYGYFTESRIKRSIAGMFGQYVPPELVAEMSEHPESATMEGENREMTVLFSDIRDFTPIAERLEPRQLTRLVNAYLSPMTRVIHQHRGTIDKYIGDAVMAFWGAPLRDPEHPRHAVLAALEMQAGMAGLMRAFAARGWPVFHIGIGVDTGLMTVGNMGSDFRRAYTVMGDSVNQASRLESLTREYGVAIIVGERTMRAVPDMVFRELDRVRVKGKREAVRIFEPLGLPGQVPDEVMAERERFAAALARYHAQDWDGAEQGIRELCTRSPDARLYALYLERIAHFRIHSPGAEWDGVFAFASK